MLGNTLIQGVYNPGVLRVTVQFIVHDTITISHQQLINTSIDTSLKMLLNETKKKKKKDKRKLNGAVNTSSAK